MQLTTVIKAFIISTKDTWAIKTAILAPLIIISLRLLLVLFDRDNDFTKHAWDNFFNGNYSFWFGLFLPIIIALTSYLLIDIDKPMRTFLFTIPIQRKNFYIAKIVIAFSIVILSSLILLILSLTVGFIVAAIKPSSGFTFNLPHLFNYFETLAMSCLASLVQVAISIWIGMRSTSFVIALSLGLTGSLINLVGIQNEFIEKFWLWIYPLDIIGILSNANTHYRGWPLSFLLLLSLTGTVLFTLLGIRELEYRDIT
jgi:lantibiotic transport system permease protein